MSQMYWERMKGVATALPELPGSFWLDDENDMYEFPLKTGSAQCLESPNTTYPCSIAVSLLSYLSRTASSMKHLYTEVKIFCSELVIALPIDSYTRSMCRIPRLPHPPNESAFLPT